MCCPRRAGAAWLAVQREFLCPLRSDAVQPEAWPAVRLAVQLDVRPAVQRVRPCGEGCALRSPAEATQCRSFRAGFRFLPRIL